MADEWWSSTRIADDDGGSPCSTAPATDQPEYAAATRTTSMPAVDAAAPTSFLADPPHHLVWTTQQAYMGRRAPEATEATTSFNALFQLHGRHFLLGQQLHADGAAAAPVAAASQSASVYAGGGNQPYSSYGGDDVPAAAALMMTKPPFPQQEFSSLFGSSRRNNSGDVPAAPPPPMTTTKPLLLQALEQNAFEVQSRKEPARDASCSSVTRSVSSSPPPAKKPRRVAMPSPLPTFKVRKEKLGDRITALQQLVSPFGKTDTASVLHEAIEYIRFLQDQVASLSSPYLRCGRPVLQQLQQQQQQAKDDSGVAKEDLRSRGLCLVPVASTTYAVATSETAAPEFWSPASGGTLR